MNNNFEIGDRVELIEYYNNRIPGDAGIVVDIKRSPFYTLLCLKMDEYFRNNNKVECCNLRVKRCEE